MVFDPDKTPILLDLLSEEIEDPQKVDVRTVDYKKLALGRLHSVVTVKRAGECREVIHYMSPEDGAAPALRVRIAYARNPANQLPLYRWTLREWFGRDGSVVASTWRQKLYSHDPNQQMQEGTRRRQNVLDELKLTVLGLLQKQAMAIIQAGIVTIPDPTSPNAMQQYGQRIEGLGVAYVDKYATELSTYERTGYIDGLRMAIATDSEAWLDLPVAQGVTTRDVVLSKLVDIGSIAPETWTAAVLAGDPSK